MLPVVSLTMSIRDAGQSAPVGVVAKLGSKDVASARRGHLVGRPVGGVWAAPAAWSRAAEADTPQLGAGLDVRPHDEATGIAHNVVARGTATDRWLTVRRPCKW